MYNYVCVCGTYGLKGWKFIFYVVSLKTLELTNELVTSYFKQRNHFFLLVYHCQIIKSLKIMYIKKEYFET